MPQIANRSHPGQARRSERKRFLQKRNQLARANDAQIEQNEVDCHIIVQGQDNWADLFKSRSVTLKEPADKIWIDYCGGTTVPYLDLLRVEADLNKVSFERTVLGKLMMMGCGLEELEVNFSARERSGWGRCVWYSDHPSYHDVPDNVRKLFPSATPRAFSFIRSMFRTQYAGVQQFTLLSTQMVAAELIDRKRVEILFHKTLIFRKAVLSPPPRAEAQQVAQAA